MDELRESSLLFSLESLLETERERVQREAREAKQRREDELKRVAEVAERRRIAAQQEREGEERRRALEAERQRLEQEHIDAVKHATVERARVEAESKMRLVEVEQARQHDLALTRIRERERSATYRAMSWLSSGAALLLCSLGAAGYFGFLRPAQARQLERWQALAAANESRAVAGERVLGVERDKNRDLSARIAELQSKLDAQAARPKVAAPSATPAPRGPRRPLRPSIEQPCDQNDPLNPCLGR